MDIVLVSLTHLFPMHPSLKIDTIGNSNISSKHLNDSGLHLNKHGKGKLAMNLIKKLRELLRRKFNRN